LFTPWAAVASGTKQLTTMTQQDLQCEAGSVLDSFVLEAKDPGGSNAEIRYAYGCCEISSHMPLAIETEQRPLVGSFSAWEGLYFPARKSEGKVEMEAGFSFRTQTISHNATLNYNKFDGSWCLASEKYEACTTSKVGHPLQLGGLGAFDVLSMKPIGRDEDTTQSGLNKISIVKFPKPPALKAIA